MGQVKIPFFSLESIFQNALQNANVNLSNIDLEIRQVFTHGTDYLYKAPPFDRPGFIRKVAYSGKNAAEVHSQLSASDREAYQRSVNCGSRN